MSTEHKNGYRQPVNFTKLVKAEFDENEKRFLLLVSDLETAEAYIEKLEQQIACGKKALAETKANELLAEGTVGSLRLQIETLKKQNQRITREVESLKRTQLAYIDWEDFVNLVISESPISSYGREIFNSDVFHADRLASDPNACWYFFSDHYQNTKINTLKQRALIQILAAHLDRAIFDTDFKNVTLAQHPVKLGEPICESVFYNQTYLGVISLQGIEVLYYPPESKGKVVGFEPEPEYYYLKEGEIVQEGDEAEVSAKWNDPAKWVPVNEHSIGRAAPDPAYMSHTKYRRKIR